MSKVKITLSIDYDEISEEIFETFDGDWEVDPGRDDFIIFRGEMNLNKINKEALQQELEPYLRVVNMEEYYE